MTAPPLTYGDLTAAALDLADRARRNLGEMHAAHTATADAERTYRVARAEARARVDASSAGERDDLVDAMTADERRVRDIARGRIEVARAAVRNVSDERSMLQTRAAWARTIGVDTSEGEGR